MVAAQEKWPDIGERISCVGPFVMLRLRTQRQNGWRCRGWRRGVRRRGVRRQRRRVMNSWPLPSRMPSNLCYKEGHPSRGQATALYTAARTRKHSCAGRTHTHTKGQSDHSQGPLRISQKTLLHPAGWRDVPPHHFQVQEKVLLFILLHPSARFFCFFCFFFCVCVFFISGGILP